MILAGIGSNYHWPRADLETLDADGLKFWAGAMGQFIARVRDQAK